MGVFTRFVQSTEMLSKVAAVIATELANLSSEDRVLRMSHLSVDVAKGIYDTWETPRQMQEDIQILIAATEKAIKEVEGSG